MRYNSLVVFALLSTPAVAFFAPNHHHAIAPIATGRVRPIRMAAEEFAEATKLALNSAPLYLAPVAALGAAQQASAQKKKLEREVAVTEEELKEIRKRLKTTDQQINVRFQYSLLIPI